MGLQTRIWVPIGRRHGLRALYKKLLIGQMDSPQPPVGFRTVGVLPCRLVSGVRVPSAVVCRQVG